MITIGKKYAFKTTQSDLTKYNNTEAEVLRSLTNKEADIFEVGNMYHIRFNDGYETDAFEDELTHKTTI